MASRSCVITGAASGIGAAVLELLRASGWKVIGADLHNADVIADLSSLEGRHRMVERVFEQCAGSVDAVIACAGLSDQSPRTVSVNYFGAIHTLTGLHPLLAGGIQPRAVAIGSLAGTFAIDRRLEEECLNDREIPALDHAGRVSPQLIYATSKSALTKWVRRNAISAARAGRGILLNALAPGFVDTPLTRERLKDEQFNEKRNKSMANLVSGILKPADVAKAVRFLASEDNVGLVGQVIYLDGGAEAVNRGDSVW